MILMNPQAFYCQSIIEQPLKELFPQLFEGAQGWLTLPSNLKCASQSFGRLNTSAASSEEDARANVPVLFYRVVFFAFGGGNVYYIECNEKNLFLAADTQTQGEFMVSAVFVQSSFSPNSHL